MLPTVPPDPDPVETSKESPFLHSAFAWLYGIDSRLHALIKSKFPRSLSVTDKTLGAIFYIVSHNAFNVIAGFVLIVLGVAGVGWVVVASLAAAWFISILWIARSEPVLRLTIVTRFLVVVCCGSALGLVASGFGDWALAKYKEQQSQKITPKLPGPNTAEIEARIDKTSLHDLFIKDFSDAGYQRATGSMSITDKEPKFSVDYSILYDLRAKSKFLVFYIPKADENFTYETCGYLARQVDFVLDKAPQVLITQKTTGDSGTISTGETVFSGRVYIYHETFLTATQTVALTELFKAKKQTVILRSIDYLSEQKMEMKVRALRGILDAPVAPKAQISTSSTTAPSPFSISMGGSIIRSEKNLVFRGAYALAYCGPNNTIVPIDFKPMVTITNRQSIGATISSISIELLTERGGWEKLIRINRNRDEKPNLFFSSDGKTMTEMSGIESVEEKLREHTLQPGESISGIAYFAFPKDHVKIASGSVPVRITVQDALGNSSQSQDRSAFDRDSILPPFSFTLWPLVDRAKYRIVLYADSCL